ncbi:MAG: calcium-translocating P-type ATPase, SERCA-type [Candidatus Woesearchaeota archaeon]
MHNKKIEGVYKELKSTSKGLTSHEAEQRLNKHGFNELKKEDNISIFKIFLEQFTSPLVWILLVALVISVILGDLADSIVIGAIVILNAVLGFVQEFRAEKSIEALQKMASLKAKVIRDGHEIKIESKFVVPGDILVLETGDKIPADARLITIHSFETQEAPLTGESLPVTKNLSILVTDTPLADRKNMVYSTTIVSKGRATAIVTATGMNGEVGKIATQIGESQQKTTPLQLKLRELGKFLTIAVVIIAVIVFLAGILSGQPASVMLLTAIALAVAAIPEGLPAVITISLALGVQRMIKRNALIRKLPSVETLGSVNVICTDKTGTLTHNQMTVTNIYANNQSYDITGSGYEAKGKFLSNGKSASLEFLDKILKAGSLCNDAILSGPKDKIEVLGDPTEAALIVSAEKAGLINKQLNNKESRIFEIPFSSERKMMTTIHKVNNSKISYTKGSPDNVLELCDKILINGRVQRLDRLKKRDLLKENEKFAQQALRVLAFAYNDKFSKNEDSEKEMVFLGFQAMIDPPREEVKEAIIKCNLAGIRVIMITGDQIATAKAIADTLGIKGKAITGQDIKNIDLNKEINNIGIFARVNPEHKLDIVKVLKKKGYIVAMTGDGVNDAPALKKADIGVSMGISGTDVAKEASDMILTDDNFTSIVNAVEEGRGIFDNIRKFVNYLLSCNLGEIGVILVASVYGFISGSAIMPLTAIQILWINLITDGLPATALSLDPHSPGIMEKKPRNAKENILSSDLKANIVLFGILITLGGFGMYLLYIGSGVMKVQTMVFTFLVVFEMMRLQAIRSEYKLGIFSNKPLFFAVILSILLQFVVVYTPLNKWFGVVPLGLVDWGVIVLMGIVLLIIYKIVSWILKKKEWIKFH